MRLDKDLGGWWPPAPSQHRVRAIESPSHTLISTLPLLSITLLVLTTYQNLKEVLVGDVGQLGAVELGDDELFDNESAMSSST